MTNIIKKPTAIEDLVSAHFDSVLSEKYGKLNGLLQTPPNNDWLKKHPLAANVSYISIGRIEMLLRQIFGIFEVKVNDYKVLANSIAVHVTLRVTNPITGAPIEQDGLGAAPIQLDKDALPTDFTKIKNNAIMLALPAAESYAIKDAAEKLGKLFGSDINRKDEIAYNDIYASTNGELHPDMKILIDECKTVEELQSVWDQNSGMKSDVAFIKAVKAKKDSLK